MNYAVLNTLIIPICALVVIAVLAATFPLRCKLQYKKWGKCIIPIPHRLNKMFIIIIVLVPIMIVMLFFRDLGTLTNAVLAATGILAIEIVLRDILTRKTAGVYENALVADTRIVLRSDIVHFPTLEYEDTDEYKAEKEADKYAADAAETAAKVLQIVTHTKGTIYIGFDSSSDRDAAVEEMRKWTGQ